MILFECTKSNPAAYINQVAWKLSHWGYAVATGTARPQKRALPHQFFGNHKLASLRFNQKTVKWRSLDNLMSAWNFITSQWTIRWIKETMTAEEKMSDKHRLSRAAVQRAGAQVYLLISLISFGGTVMVTRLFLFLTGYPKIGRGDLHIAHVLWGGLILFMAALLPLIFSNRWVYILGAVLSGVGVGLFIDEVGKFITMNNNYFYPPAAPIIYALFLLTVLVYMRVRRPSTWSPRDELYRALDDFGEVLDHDLEPDEKQVLQQRLARIAEKAQEEDLAHLAQFLCEYLATEKVRIVPQRTTLFERTLNSLIQAEKRFFNRNRMRLALLLGLAILGALTIYQALGGILPHGQIAGMEGILSVYILKGEVRSPAGAIWFMVHLSIQMISGILALLSAGLLAAGKEKRGISFATISLVLFLTLGALLSFFVDQFSAVFSALTQFVIFLGVIYYRRRYIRANPPL
jgi:hypothetical protein